ncbi:hypothetical protein PGT21_002594 [Puccinia graminis f. sp. tritici]|uniref:Uncharacterized protein n=1 Tax=Puccinia graminis f. sp. tritici TaxID=56615 RepID=A0A5B0RQY9_PUCGR|nr:hypothetical protein PGT21_002594 [Puccinia graminis f. sp. tritici]KAA1128047.1 hypothetical protein PGTUg99_015939 [Puccinia graminis f. sp. tritici]
MVFHHHGALAFYGALFMLAAIKHTPCAGAILSKRAFPDLKVGGNGRICEQDLPQIGHTNLVEQDNQLHLSKTADLVKIPQIYAHSLQYDPVYGMYFHKKGFVSLNEYYTLSVKDGKTSPERINAFVDDFVVYYTKHHMGKDLQEREEQFKKLRIDPIEVCKIQLGWLKENVKENPNAKELNNGKTVDDVLQKIMNISQGKISQINSIEIYGKEMQDVLQLDKDKMKQFVDSYIENQLKEHLKQNLKLHISDMVAFHIDWAKLHDQKNIYVVTMDEIGVKYATTLKLMENNLRKHELSSIIDKLSENDDQYKHSREDLESFIYKQGGNAASDLSGDAWNTEKVEKMFGAWKKQKSETHIQPAKVSSRSYLITHSRMLTREHFNRLLPRIFQIEPKLAKILNKEIKDDCQFHRTSYHTLGDIEEIKDRSHFWTQLLYDVSHREIIHGYDIHGRKLLESPKFFGLPILISTHLDWLQKNDKLPIQIANKVTSGDTLEEITEELEPKFSKMKLEEFYDLIPFDDPEEKNMFENYGYSEGGRLKHGYWEIDHYEELYRKWIKSQKNTSLKEDEPRFEQEDKVVSLLDNEPKFDQEKTPAKEANQKSDQEDKPSFWKKIVKGFWNLVQKIKNFFQKKSQ